MTMHMCGMCVHLERKIDHITSTPHEHCAIGNNSQSIEATSSEMKRDKRGGWYSLPMTMVTSCTFQREKSSRCLAKSALSAS
jgi:hypothetical protein